MTINTAVISGRTPFTPRYNVKVQVQCQGTMSRYKFLDPQGESCVFRWSISGGLLPVFRPTLRVPLPWAENRNICI